ncbi:hypothetical protein KGQ71_03410 [Patescibacteria group bacterium]|nr:hypothetical protein [Patescibacteria group bacterium]
MESETPELTPTPPKSSLFPVVILAVIVVGLASGIGVYAYQKHQQNTSEQNLQSQINTLKSQLAAKPSSATSALSIAPSTADWKTFTDPDYGLSFKYPNSWSAGAIVNETAGTYPFTFDANAAAFNASDATVHVLLTSYAALNNDVNKSKLQKLRDIYSAKAVVNGLLPNGVIYDNASAFLDNSYPAYIQTEDGTWRGAYFYSTQRQNDPDPHAQNVNLDHLFIYISDGKSKVIEFDIHTTASQYTPLAACTSNHPTCSRPDALAAGIDSMYKPLLETIKAQ